MKLRKDELLHALNSVSRALPLKPILPILGNILFSISPPGILKIAATNLEFIVVNKTLLDDNGENYKTALPGKTFLDLISSMNTDEVELEFVDGVNSHMKIVGENSKNRINCTNANNFPLLPKFEEVTLEMPTEDFRAMVSKVTFCTSTNTLSPVLQGVLTTVEDRQIRMIGVDGFRYSIIESSVAPVSQMQINIPSKYMDEISRISFNQTIKFSITGKSLLFSCGEVEGAVLAIDGEYPDWKQFPKSESGTKIKLSTVNVLHACKQARIFTNEDKDILNIDIQGMMMEISSESGQSGNSKVTVPVSVEGQPVKTKIKAAQLIQFLTVIEKPEIEMIIEGAKKPITFDAGFLHVIMPNV